MRGTPVGTGSKVSFTRIIPAHAGNTLTAYSLVLECRDHPRACGEHLYPPFDRCAPSGSSPRMRGTPDIAPSSSYPARIIPAHAGNTLISRSSTRRTWDHPRACGEHRFTTFRVETSSGSSPRMRGTHRGNFRAGSSTGIIPAHAGNTIRPGGYLDTCWDHPRACGEHKIGAFIISLM